MQSLLRDERVTSQLWKRLLTTWKARREMFQYNPLTKKKWSTKRKRSNEMKPLFIGNLTTKLPPLQVNKCIATCYFMWSYYFASQPYNSTLRAILLCQATGKSWTYIALNGDVILFRFTSTPLLLPTNSWIGQQHKPIWSYDLYRIDFTTKTK